MIEEFSRQLGRELEAKSIRVKTGQVAVDGFHQDDNRVTFVEVWAHFGKAKPAQRHKVLSDILKLALVTSDWRRSHPNLTVECYLLFGDEDAKNVVNGNGWASVSAKEFGIEARVITLPLDVVEAIKEAQKRQDIRFDDCDDSQAYGR
jgi:hypothetical protein